MPGEDLPATSGTAATPSRWNASGLQPEPPRSPIHVRPVLPQRRRLDLRTDPTVQRQLDEKEPTEHVPSKRHYEEPEVEHPSSTVEEQGAHYLRTIRPEIAQRTLFSAIQIGEEGGEGEGHHVVPLDLGRLFPNAKGVQALRTRWTLFYLLVLPGMSIQHR